MMKKSSSTSSNGNTRGISLAQSSSMSPKTTNKILDVEYIGKNHTRIIANRLIDMSVLCRRITTTAVCQCLPDVYLINMDFSSDEDDEQQPLPQEPTKPIDRENLESDESEDLESGEEGQEEESEGEDLESEEDDERPKKKLKKSKGQKRNIFIDDLARVDDDDDDDDDGDAEDGFEYGKNQQQGKVLLLQVIVIN